jgi:dihydroorotate dehydrogenase electron transfer subunit
MRVARLTKVAAETAVDVTVEFRDSAPITPGQFYMFWILGAEEVPMSASLIGKDGRRGATARNFGPTTARMGELKAGERVGVRGPFGCGFSMDWKKPLFVGGGAGMASIITAVDAWASRGRKPVVVVGGRSSSDLLFEKRLKRLGAELHLTTDDGSKGFRGTAVTRAAQLMDSRAFSDVITCGPERMLVALLKEASARKVRVEAALERLMKCAMGVCDICSIDGVRVCRQGPVFDSKFMLASKQFGRVELDASGHLEPI